jgi:toxin ParE1/3/4
MRIVWAESARQEWARQYRFYYARNTDAARRIRRLVMSAVERLRDYPKIGRPGRVEGTRELVISGTPFLIVYDENPARVEIVHVYHGRQNWQDEVEG